MSLCPRSNLYQISALTLWLIISTIIRRINLKLIYFKRYSFLVSKYVFVLRVTFISSLVIVRQADHYPLRMFTI